MANSRNLGLAVFAPGAGPCVLGIEGAIMNSSANAVTVITHAAAISHDVDFDYLLANSDALESFIRNEQIDEFRRLVSEAMLRRIVMFGSDPAFEALSQQLATTISIPISEARELLWPRSHAIYKAAEAAANV